MMNSYPIGRLFSFVLFCFYFLNVSAQNDSVDFKVIAFYIAKNDLAHISFVHEAKKWFPEMGKKYHFIYHSTNDWNNLNAKFLSHYQVVIFLDIRPGDPAQRIVFQKYMENGGGWMGFHFSAFVLTPSDYPMNWDCITINF